MLGVHASGMIRMEDANFMPGDDKFSPSMGLLNYQWSDSLLQAELQELELVSGFHPVTPYKWLAAARWLPASSSERSRHPSC